MTGPVMTCRTSRPVADIRWVSLDEADAEEDVGTDHTVILLYGWVGEPSLLSDCWRIHIAYGSARADREEENG